MSPRTALAVAFGALAAFVVVGTLLPLWRSSVWWVRAWDFGRSQLFAIGLVGLLLFAARWAGGLPRFRFEVALAILLLGSVLFQAWRILPYTPLYPKQSLAATPGAPDRISLLVSNVLMHNRDAEPLIEWVRAKDPDLFFAAETDQSWIDQLSVLDARYPHRVVQPLDNTYGFALFSTRELIAHEIRFLVDADIPSLRARVRLASGRVVQLHFLHPKPPSPTESWTSAKRDAEILIVGREVRKSDRPTIVAGDLNDVAWSHTTRLFQRISGMLDPRVGRGLFSTFHAEIPLLRWPLDHVFHTEHFKLVDLERGPDVGSDHFPMYVELAFESDAPIEQEAPRPEDDDLQEAQEKVVDGVTEPPDEAEPPLGEDEESPEGARDTPGGL